MSKFSKEKIKQFANSFSGSMRAHGLVDFTGTRDKDGKQEGKYAVIHKGVNEATFLAHLKGSVSIVRPMLKEDNTVSFGVIDIDDYNLDTIAFSKKVYALKLPFSPCLSKSGGIHAYVFFDKDYPAAKVRQALLCIAEALGYKGTEVFPKMVKHTSEKSVGGLINLPYHNAENTTRYCLLNGKKLSFEEFLDHVENNKISLDDLLNHDLIKAVKMPESKSAGKIPQSSLTQTSANVDYAGRNDALFKELCRMRARMNWQEDFLRVMAHALNESCPTNLHENFSQGPLEGSEVENIIQAVMQYDSSIPEHESYTQDEAIECMNSKYVIVMEGGKTIVMHQKHDPVLGRLKLVRSNTTDINKLHKEPVIIPRRDEPHIIIPLGKYWLENPRARRYDSVIFYPGKTTANCYNLWQGFAVEARKGKCDLLLKHVKDNICDGNEEYYNYLIKWFARMIQEPHKQAEVAIVLRGGRGVGKSIFFRMVGRLLGQHFLQISNARHLVGNFNAHLLDTIMLFCDEAFYAGDKAGEAVIKTLITESTILIERKGQDAYDAPNYLHIVMASNNDWVIPAGIDERRFFVLDVAEHQKQNKPYFKAITDQMEDGGYEALLYELQNMDISDFDFRTAPKTKALTEQKSLSLSPEHSWIYNKLMEGHLLENDHGWVTAVKKSALQKDYVRACQDMGVPRKSSPTALGMMLKKLFPTIQSIRQSDGLYYLFPSLDDCRRCFDEIIGETIIWPELVTDEDIDNTGDLYEID